MFEMVEISEYFDENEETYEGFGEHFYWKYSEAKYFSEHAKAWRGENEGKIEFSDGWKVKIWLQGPFVGVELLDDKGKKIEEKELLETDLEGFVEKIESWCLDHVMKMMTEEAISERFL